MQGYGKVFSWGIENVYNNAFKPYEAMGLPSWLLWFAVFFTSYVELIGGGLLVLGLLKRLALYGLGFVLLIVAFGHGFAEPIWQLDHVLYRAILLAAVLIIPHFWDTWTLEALGRRYLR